MPLRPFITGLLVAFGTAGAVYCSQLPAMAQAGAAVQQYLAIEPQRPLFAIVAERNVASRRVLSRCGFREISKKGDVLRYQLSAGRLRPPELPFGVR